MAFFTSEYECKLDSKGRLALPAKLKASLPEVSTNELVLRKGFEANLILYPMVEYKKTHQRISSLSEFNPEHRQLKRIFFRSISQVEMDSAGRILIPKNMLAHAKIDKTSVVVGMGNYIEIWDPKVFDESLGDSGDEFSKLALKYLNE